METILLTGGMGFIGSHTCVELLKQGYAVVLVDNLVNSDRSVLGRIRKISGQDVPFYEVDVCDRYKLAAIFQKHPIDAVIHFAGLKAVGESKEKPLAYYRNNLNATLTLLECMQQAEITRLVFSSSATVYGAAGDHPLTESDPLSCNNPYGRTKLMSEQIISDYAETVPNFSALLLRYFNPVGAHESGQLGENPNGIPQNLMPFLNQVAVGIRPKFSVFGGDYQTPDGTAIRDYIHITDLARGHISALRYSKTHTGTDAINLGTGHGVSVLEMIHAYREANNVTLPYEVTGRRAGDVAVCYANPKKAIELLDWRAELGLLDMCRSAYRWQQNITTMSP
ncbi:MAG: UDP-glucose 4-epimerase GalE [Evtepia sp.]